MTKIPRAFPGHRETLHKAMGAIIATGDWWDLSAAQAIGIGMNATNGAASPRDIVDEFYAMLKERGL